MPFPMGRVFRRAQLIVRNLPDSHQRSEWTCWFLPLRPGMPMFGVDELIHDAHLGVPLPEPSMEVSNDSLISSLFVVTDSVLFVFRIKFDKYRLLRSTESTTSTGFSTLFSSKGPFTRHRRHLNLQVVTKSGRFWR